MSAHTSGPDGTSPPTGVGCLVKSQLTCVSLTFNEAREQGSGVSAQRSCQQHVSPGNRATRESPDEKHLRPEDLLICFEQTHVDVNYLMTVLGFSTVPVFGLALSL